LTPERARAASPPPKISFSEFSSYNNRGEKSMQGAGNLGKGLQMQALGNRGDFDAGREKIFIY
jgi:hypothetical protein